MKRIYVAGPYTAKDPRETQMNVDKAISIGCQLITKGYAPFIPHLSHYIWLHPEGNFNYSKWTELDFEWLGTCEAFFFIAHSRGADAELNAAKAIDLPVYYDIDEVPTLV